MQYRGSTVAAAAPREDHPRSATPARRRETLPNRRRDPDNVVRARMRGWRLFRPEKRDGTACRVPRCGGTGRNVRRAHDPETAGSSPAPATSPSDDPSVRFASPRPIPFPTHRAGRGLTTSTPLPRASLPRGWHQRPSRDSPFERPPHFDTIAAGAVAGPHHSATSWARTATVRLRGATSRTQYE